MAVFRPHEAFLRKQIVSIAKQDHLDVNVLFVIADQTSELLVRKLSDAAGLNYRIFVPSAPLDAVHAFEVGLQEALSFSGPDTLFALSDQDDIWRRDRLSRGVTAIRESNADLVHSDARLIGQNDEVLHSSMFAYEKRQKRPGLRDSLYRNTITGMTVLMRRRLVEIALPLPAQSGVHFYHDLWLGLIAHCSGGVHLIDEPLVDYRQHGTNAIGAVDRRSGSAFFQPSLTWLRREAASYGLARYLAKSVVLRMHEVIAAKEADGDGEKLLPLKPYLNRLRGAGAHGLDAFRLLLAGHRDLALTAATFSVIATGRVVWSVRRALGDGLTEAVTSFDNRLYSLSPGLPPSDRRSEQSPESVASSYAGIIDQRKLLRWQPEFSVDRPAVNVLVPTLNPTEIFAGIVTAIDIGLGLAERGHDVRFVATDLPISSNGVSRDFILARMHERTCGNGTAERITLACGVTRRTIEMHRDDAFIATAWWTAYVAQDAIRSHGFHQSQFLYLIQDYEPAFYAWGSEFADATASYEMDFRPIFNTTLLRDHFAEQGFAFATPDAWVFHPSIDVTRFSRSASTMRSARRRLALYGRPEVPRNMFSMAIEVLAKFIEEEGLRNDDVELVSIGLKHNPVRLPNSIILKSLGKIPWDAYPNYLSEIDVGLSLMLSPHPSHPPIEMAAAGARVVTNSFATKDLSVLCPSIVSAVASVDPLVAALRKAWNSDPVSKEERQIDLRRIGEPLDEVVSKISLELKQRLIQVDYA